MQSSVEALLGQLSAHATSERDKGDSFERLVRDFLKVDTAWSRRFAEVHLWMDWPERGNRTDMGIDLVAIDRETGAPVAIQCKFYARDHYLTKPDIDSFLAESGKHPFAGRLIVSTTDRWNSAAEHAIQDQQIPVQRIGLADLINSSIDWEQFSFDSAAALATKPNKQLRPHQQAALDQVRDGFEAADRGKLIMACGTGKTFTSLRIAEDLVGAGGSVLFLVPSITLLSQSLKEWSQEAKVPLRTFAVCSDAKVGKDRAASEDISVVDLEIPATTDPARLAQQVKRQVAPTLPQVPDAVPQVPAPSRGDRGASAAGGAGGERVPDAAPGAPAPGHGSGGASAASGAVGASGGEGTASGAMTVVFSTYQSIDVIHQAQAAGLGPFDLIICDEAHRTTGATLVGADESAFVKVHGDAFIRGARRLYMTATPRIYDDASKAKAGEAEALLASMDDESLYGPEFHRLDFGEAVGLGLLSDYRVLILTVPEDAVSRVMQSAFAVNSELNLPDAAKIIGCWNGLAKRGDPGAAFPSDPEPMRRAVAFCQSIKTSKLFREEFAEVAGHYAGLLEEEATTVEADGSIRVADLDLLDADVQHVDGTMNILQRNASLDWLRSEPAEGRCRVLTNARCLAEGVDVPALDAVIFLNPRRSEVDVVQAVGRVMRKAPGKKYGYIILPIGIPAGESPDQALKRNERYQVVWKVLQALRAHDSRFNAMINQIDLNHSAPDQIQVIGVDVPGGGDGDGGDGAGTGAASGPVAVQDFLPGDWDQWRDAIYAKIVEKVGSRRYWEDWARDVAGIVQAHTTRLTDLIERGDPRIAEAFAAFLAALKANLNNSIDRAQAIDMLSQHMVTKPVFDALFEGYSFSEHNPVAQVMQRMLDALEGSSLEAETSTLDKFYESVRLRVQGIDNAAGKQRVLMELYEKFFRLAFKKTAESLGIVYTPVEVVDFIIRAVDDLLGEHFGESLTADGVHVLDPFTGTGTFLVRLLESGLIAQEDLARKYAHELHANEILLLAYYIAAANIEVTYHALASGDAGLGPGGAGLEPDGVGLEPDGVGLEPDGVGLGPGGGAACPAHDSANAARLLESHARATPRHAAPPPGLDDSPAPGHVPFPGIVLADTFQMTEAGDTLDQAVFQANNDRAAAQLELPIQVILGNPPYSVGQTSGNDDNQNVKYPTLDSRIEETYARRSTAVNKNSLYDSYIRAIRWASDRIGTQGVVAFVSNGGYIDGNTADGLRQCLADEFSAVYVYNLRGNQRTAGEQSRREGGKIFGSGSRATVAILLLVKKPGQTGPADLFYQDIGDYLTREQKLAQVAGATLASLPWRRITPNAHGDWLGQRSDAFAGFMPLASGKGETGIFDLNSPGLQTNRDAWVYSFSERVLRAQVAGIVETYNADVARLDGTPQEDRGGLATKDPAKISWSSSLLQRLARGDRLSVRDGQFVIGSYRPFNRQRVYFADTLNHRVGKMPQFFPTREHSNTGFVLTGISSHYDFSLMAVDAIPDLHLLDTGVCFPRWRYEPIPDADGPAAAGAGTQGALDLAGVPGRASGGDDAATDPADAGAQGALDLAGVGRAGRENEAAADSTGAGGADQAGAAQGEGGGGGAGADEAGDGIVHGYRRIDNITDAALAAFRHAYGRRVTKDDVFHYVYGLLHSADYRREFGADLKKSLPRVPLVASREAFEAFAAAGRELMALHLGYEQAEPWPDLAITGDHPDGDPHAWYRVEKMRYATAGKAKDKTAVVYNPRITVSGIPPEAQDYLLGARSAIDWILERYQVKTDKASGIVNDPNDWSLEHGAPRHILDLLTRVVTVSARTVEITAGLPPLSSSDRDVTTHVDDRRQGDQP